MKQIVAVFLLSLFCTTISAGEGSKDKNLNLELETDLHSLRVGQTASIELKIVGNAIKEIIKDANSSDLFFSTKAPEFVYTFPYHPQKEGEYKLGPYSLSFNGMDLKSNSVKIKVLPGWNGEFGMFFRTDCNEISLGSSFEVVMEIWSKKPIQSHVFEMFKPLIAIIDPGVTINQDFTKNGEKCYYFMKSWKIYPRYKGEFVITKDFFEAFPDDAKMPQLEVLVK